MLRPHRIGTVTLTGAGPGDPELVTIKAQRALRLCDIVVYDRLVSLDILDLAPPSAHRIYVGKASGQHSMSQSEINALLVRLAEQGKNVVRLKGGDPFVFGRGGEEMLHLRRAGVPCRVIPGVTAASGAAAAFGFPLTQRGLATGVKFITGHMKDNETIDLDWTSLADPQTTIIVYMGLESIEFLVSKLINAGRNHKTPSAVVSTATTLSQRMVCGYLGELPSRCALTGLTTPSLVAIGEVVALSIEWVDQIQSVATPGSSKIHVECTELEQNCQSLEVLA